MTVAARAADETVCQPKIAASLDMQVLADGRVAVPLGIGDRPYMFLVDTAGVFSTISPDLVSQLGLAQHHTPIRLYGVADTTLDRFVTIDDYRMGALQGSHLTLYVEPGTPSPASLSGTLGADLLRDYDVDLDFGAGKLNLVSPQDCTRRPVYWTGDPYATIAMTMESQADSTAMAAGFAIRRPERTLRDRERNGHIRFPVTLDGKPMTATLDTGAQFSIMSRAAARRFLGIDDDTPGLQPVTSELASQVYTYPFAAISFTGVTVNTPHIFILPDSAMRNQGTDVILGIGILRQFHIYIAYKAHRLYVTPAAAH